MKKSILIAASFLFSILVFSCKKEKTPAPVTPPTTHKALTGTKWTGYYDNGSGTSQKYYMFSFFSDDSILVNANDATNPSVAKGTWTITNGVLTSYYTYTTGDSYSITAADPGKTNTMTGTWGMDNDNSNGGSFSLTK